MTDENAAADAANDTTNADTGATDTGEGKGNDSTLAEGTEKATDGKDRAPDGKFKGKDKDGQTDAKTPPATDWRDSIEDPELRKVADRLASPADAVKSVADLRKEISSRIKLPGKDAKDEDIAAFRKALGAPESPDGYEFPKPSEDYEPNETEKAVQSKVAEVLHKHHAPAAMAGELSAVVAEMAEGIKAEEARVAEQHRETMLADLKKEWGADFDANKNMAIRAVEAFGGDELKQVFNETKINGVPLGDHPALVKAFGQIGRRMGEGEFLGAVDGEQAQTLAQRVDELTEQMHRALNKGDKTTAARLDAERNEVTAKLYGSSPIVGSSGRAA